MISIIYDAHHPPDVIICGRDTQGHMTHRATQVNLHARVKEELRIMITIAAIFNNQHIDAEGTDITWKAQPLRYFLLD